MTTAAGASPPTGSRVLARMTPRLGAWARALATPWSRASISLRAGLVFAAVAMSLPWLVLVAVFALGAAPPRWAWVLGPVALAVALGIAWLVAGYARGLIWGLAASVRSVGRGEAPAPLPPSIQEIDDLARVIHAAGMSRSDAEAELRTERARLDGVIGVATESLALTLRDVAERRQADEERVALLARERAARSAAEAEARRAGFLDHAGRALAASLDSGAGLERLAHVAAETAADWCLVDVVEDDGGLRRLFARRTGAGEAAPLVRERRGPSSEMPELIRKALAAQQPLVVPDATDADAHRLAFDPEEADLLRRLGARSLVVAPFPGARGAVGAITLARAADPGQPIDVELATELARRAATAVEHGALHRRAHEAQRRFGGLVEGLEAIVWAADPASLGLSFVSQHVERLLGYAPQEWVAAPDAWLGVVHPDDRGVVTARLQECGRTGRACRLEYRVRAVDDRIVWLDTAVQLVRDPVSGPHLYGLAIDASERKRLEEEHDRRLATEHGARVEAESVARRSRFLAEASELLVSSLDYEATLHSLARLAVPTFADWCLVQLIEAEGARRMHAACADPDRAGLAASLETLSPSVNMASLSPILDLFQRGDALVVPEIDGAWLEALRVVQALGPRSIMVVPLVARNRSLGSLTFISTVPDRRYGPADLALAKDLAQRAAVAVDNARLYREAADANRAKDEFLATVSHELRTPLTAMLGWVHMLRSGRLGADEARQALASIERNTRAQALLINDLLDISRVAAGKLPVDMHPLDLRGVVEHAIESIRQDADARRLTLACELDPAAVWVHGDAVRLEQVVVNLLGNAVKFTPAGGRIDVSLERDAGTARVSVRDTGQGIDSELLPHVFDSFRQAETGSTRRHGGLGLGLAIVRHLVALHGGRVEASSPGRGQGATFTMLLPVLESAPAAEPTAIDRRRSTSAADPPRLEHVHVLVVDDHEDTRQLVKAVLADSGAVVELAASVPDAVAALRDKPVDVVICDIEMPDLDGYALLPPLRAAERERRRHVPAIALTAYASADDRARALTAGFDAHVAKPIGATDLVAAVARALAA